MHLLLKIAEASVLWGREAARRRKNRKKGRLIFQAMQPRSSPWHCEWERCELLALVGGAQ